MSAFCRSFLEKTFWTQSMQLLVIAARKPIVSKLSSVEEHRTRPAITGTSDMTTSSEVFSSNMIRAKTTVNNGAEALIVSVKDTATCERDTNPNMTVVPRITPTKAMLRKK